MEEYININTFIKNYDDYKDTTQIDQTQGDLYYNDTIINYDEI